MKRRLLVAILAAAMVVTMMPLLVFGAEAKPVSFTFTPAEPLEGYIGECWADNLVTPGSYADVKFSDNTTKRYYAVVDEEHWGFYLNGDPESGSFIAFGENVTDGSDILRAGYNDMDLDLYYNGGEESLARITVKVKGIKCDYIDSISYQQKKPIEATLDGDWVNYMGNDDEYMKPFLGDRVKINFTKSVIDEENKVIEEDNEDSDEPEPLLDYSVVYECQEDEDGIRYCLVEGNSYLGDYIDSPSIWDTQYQKPWEFGKKYELTVSLYGIIAPEKLVVKVTDEIKRTEIYADADDWALKYNGKVRKPSKVKVYELLGYKDNWEPILGKEYSSSEYKIEYPSSKKIGEYDAKVTLDDGLGTQTYLSYEITPNNLKGVKYTGAKKSIKVSWKKPASAEYKQIDGYLIQYIIGNTNKTLKVAKSKTSYTVKKLKSKKTYYISVVPYKKSTYGYNITPIPYKFKSVKTK